MVASSVSHGIVVTVMALAAGSINAVLKVAMVPTKQLTIARTRGRDSRRECGPTQQSHTVSN